MNMNVFIQCWFKCKVGSGLITILSLFCFASFPAYSFSFASNSITSLGFISFTFILGLSLPIAALSLFGLFKGKYKLGLFLLSTISLLVVIYLIAFAEPINTYDVFLISVVYLASLFGSSSFKNRGDLPSVVILIPFLLSALYFSISIFLWVNKEISQQWFLINGVGSYLVYLLTSCCVVAKEEFSTKNPTDNSFADAEKIEGNNFSDPTTNLPSKKHAFKCINTALENSTKKQFALVVFKPINFQQMNKILGYKNSDILLLQLTYSLQKSIEHNEQLVSFSQHGLPIRIAHLRGVHLLSVLQLKEGEKNKEAFVESFCKELTMAVPAAMSFKSFSLNFQLAFGVSFINQGVKSLSQNVSHAEDALLTAESNEKLISYFNKDAVLYTESHLVQMERLKQDIINDRFHWFVQPQRSIRNNKLTGFELLVKWHDSEGVPVEFNRFIDIAEHSGEIYLLTKNMLTKAFKLILKLQRVSNYEKVSVKLLSPCLLEPDLVSFIERQIVTYNVPAKYLVIELPEAVVSSASDKAKAIIDELKLLKVNIAISDFSGSYESLRYIRKMSVDQIKIDCEHINDNVSETESIIIMSLIELTKKMELPLIGTSINTKAIEKAFTLIGGEFVQGNVVDKGIDYDNIDAWVTTWNKSNNPI